MQNHEISHTKLSQTTHWVIFLVLFLVLNQFWTISIHILISDTKFKPLPNGKKTHITYSIYGFSSRKCEALGGDRVHVYISTGEFLVLLACVKYNV